MQRLLWTLLVTAVLAWLLYEEPAPSPEAASESGLLAWNALPDSPDRLAKYQFDIRTKPGDAGPTYTVSYRVRALEKARALKKGPSIQRDWVSRGPGNVGGRTRGLVVDPDDPTGNTWFVGSVSGGVWKTTNAGQSWTNMTTDLPNLATGTLAMAASNHDVLYAGTGEGFGNLGAVAGDGMWKSTDRGQSWTQLASTTEDPDFRWVFRIIVDPADENTLVVAAGTSIFRSTNGGNTFDRVFTAPSSRRVNQVIDTPGNFSVQYAAVNAYRVYKSTDAGQSWQPIGCSNLLPAGRIELAVSPVDPDWLYASVDETISALWVSEDGGDTCAKAVDSSSEPNWLGNLGWYANTIAAHPFDTRKVFVGGLNAYRIDLRDNTVNRVGLKGMNTSEVEPFLTFVSFTDGTLPGLGLGPEEGAVDLSDDDFVSVEVRWGPGMSQKAHRFIVPFESTSGVPPQDYSYQDYVDVPFEVWDVTNNRQLMVSFRDQRRDGQFDLLEYEQRGGDGREYVFINAIPYDPDEPHPQIVRAGGHTQKLVYFLWFTLADGLSWDPGTIPTSSFSIEWGEQTVRLSSSTQLSDWTQYLLHADLHGLMIANVDQGAGTFRIISTNDGGISLSENNGNSWGMRIGGYVTTQFYGADKSPTDDIYIGGTQDNGTWLSPAGAQQNSTWSWPQGGDGFEVVWHETDPQLVLATINDNRITRSEDGGLNFALSVAGMTDAGSGDVFVGRLSKSRIDPDLVFAVGESGIWRTDNFAQNWRLSPIPSGQWKAAGEEIEVAVSDANAQIVWAGTGITNGRTRRLHLSTDGGLSFQPVSVLDNDFGFLSGLETHPVDEQTAYALFSMQGEPKILRTTDLGASWEDISGFAASNGKSDNGFPDVATYSLLVMPHNPNEIWAGTEIGLFISQDNGVTWEYADDGLPAAPIWQMRIVGDEVVVATYGRGVWSLEIPELLTAPPPDIAVAPRLNNAFWNVTGRAEIDLNFLGAFDSVQVRVNGETVGSVGAVEAGRRTVTAKYNPNGVEEIEVQAVAYQNGKTFFAPSARVTAFARPPRTAEYINELNSASDLDDFIGDGFSIQTGDAFEWLALGTVSPYPPSTELTFTLKTPIQVSEANPMMSWSDVALVQPGLDGFEYPHAGFRDYVIVEATANGLTWVPLVDGYDAGYDPAWLSAYSSRLAPTFEDFRTHSANLMDFFSADQIIYIRFRLFSDQTNVGYGWVIDRLEIQEGAPVANEGLAADIPREFLLEPNYPNPFNPSTNIRFALPERREVEVSVFDVNGRLVKTLVSGDVAAGRHTVSWDASGFASGTYFYRLQAGDFVQTRKMLLVK